MVTLQMIETRPGVPPKGTLAENGEGTIDCIDALAGMPLIMPMINMTRDESRRTELIINLVSRDSEVL